MKATIEKIWKDCTALLDDAALLVAGGGAGGNAKVTGDLALLTKENKLLHDAWSEMAIRNLLSDMLRILTRIGTYDLKPTWVSGVKPAPPPAIGGHRAIPVPPKPSAEVVKAALFKDKIAALKTLMSTELAKHSPLNSKYKKVLCAGYKVRTVRGSYKGRSDDAADMLSRCRDLKRAILGAHNLAAPYNADGSILKVFMAPEFFFRGANGAYDHGIVHGLDAQPDKAKAAVKGIMDVMSEEIDKPIYNDWLFVMGTAIAATKVVETKCLQCGADVNFVKDASTGKTKPVCKVDKAHPTGEKTKGAMVENVALIRKEKEPHVIAKELVSDADFSSGGVEGWLSVDVKGRSEVPDSSSALMAMRNPANWSADVKASKFTDERMGGCIFTINGITIGLEVCLDHAASAANLSAGRLEHAGNIQVQLIPSGGMSIAKLRTVAGGVVFNVDGTTPHVLVVAGSTADADLLTIGPGAWPVTKDVATTRIAAAGKGSVLLYGPYDLPAV